MSQATFRFPRVHSQEQVRVTSDSGGATVVARLRADLRGQLQNLVGPDGVTTLYLQSETGTATVTGTVPVDVTPVGQAAVDTAVAALVTGAPAALDTLDELAAALGDDANFAATITTALAARLTTVSHGSTAGTARPTSTLPVLWIGTVAPTNRATRDLWMDETAVALKRWDGATWAASGGSSVASLTPTAVKTSAYTAAAGEYVPVDTTSGNITITLPSAPADKAQVGIKHVVRGGTNTVGVLCGGSDVLNKAGGATSGTIMLLNQSAVLQYKASSGIWYVVSGDTPASQLVQRGQGKSDISSWHRALATNPAACSLLFLGDSTSFGPGGFPYTRVRSYHTLPGQGLEGMTGDATHFPDGGNNGLTLSGWWAGSGGTYTYAQVQALYASTVAAGGALHIVFSFGINDLRQFVDQIGLTGAKYLTLQALVKTVIDQMLTDMPDLTMTLRVPNAMLLENVAGLNSITATDGTINPAGGAQALTDALRNLYLGMEGRWPQVVVWDAQARIFGRTALSSTQTNLVANQLHPSTAGYTAVVDTVIDEVVGLPIGHPKRIPNPTQSGGTYTGIIATTADSWSIDPYELLNPDHYTPVADVALINAITSASSFITIGPLPNGLVGPSDLLLITHPAGAYAYRLPSNVNFAAPSSGGPITNLQINSVSTLTTALNGVASGARVRVFRDYDRGGALLGAVRRRPTPKAYRWSWTGVIADTLPTIVAQGGASEMPSMHLPLTQADSAIMDDGTVVSLSSAGFLLNGSHLRLSGTGKTFASGDVGKLITFYGQHAGIGEDERRIVSVDLPSIAAGATVTFDVTVSGARNRADGGSVNSAGALDQNWVTVTPPTIFNTDGLVLLNAYVTTTDTVRLVILNPTGAAVDEAAKQWAFKLHQ